MNKTLVYDPSFLRQIQEKKFDRAFLESEWPKLSQAAEVHGYRGPSKKKKNGIVPIRPADKGLLKTLERLRKDSSLMIPLIGVPIKVVAHVPSGNRLVGYKVGERVFVLGRANYQD